MSRTEFTKAVKRRIAERSIGICERHRWRPGEDCLKPAKEFDHIIPDGLDGEATYENGAHLCIPCHKEKTAKHDTPTIARADLRRDRLVYGIKPKGPKLQSRGFPKAEKREPRKPLPPKGLFQ